MSLVVDIRKKLDVFTLEVSLEAASETLGLLGESGCGKSMTMRCIAGVETPDEGKIIVNGETYYDSAANINLKPQERRTALLFQNYQLFPHMTVAANVGAGIPKDTDADERARIIDTELKRFGIEALAKRYPLQLSGGQQQRVALARMLAASPSILMLDEPFSALDAHLKSTLEQNLSSLFDEFEGTILYVSHDIDEAVRFCDHIAVMDAGRPREVDTPDELVAAPRSEAGMRISGMKNVTPAEYVDAHTAHLPAWGVDVTSDQELSPDITHMGIREFYLERAEEPGPNTYRVVVDRVSDSRFTRTAAVRFLEGSHANDTAGLELKDTGTYLSRILTWNLDRLAVPVEDLPQKGDELFIRLPKEHLCFVER